MITSGFSREGSALAYAISSVALSRCFRDAVAEVILSPRIYFRRARENRSLTSFVMTNVDSFVMTNFKFAVMNFKALRDDKP